MRLIDADALLEKMKKTDRYFNIKFDIEDAPTVDAVAVIRCADCKYSGAWFGHTMKCKRFHQLFDESFYCAFGEWVEE